VSRRNNLERSGAADKDAAPPPTAVTQQDGGDIFSFITPTEFVDLPSQGLLYPEGHPLHKIATIEIRHMTAKEEDILTSESLIKKGLALDRLLQSIVADKRIKPDDLLIGDKNALLVAARVTGFGSLYETQVTCPSCVTAATTALDLDGIKTKNFQELPENVTTTEEGNYVITLPDFNDLEVEVRLLTGRHEKALMQKRDKRRKLKLPDTNVTDQLTAIIARVNEITDPTLLAQFAEQVPTRVSRRLRTIYEDLVPDLDMTFDFECDNCGHVGKVGMPISADFFWPDT